MGSSVGLSKYDNEFNSVFVDARMKFGEALIRKNTAVRASFVEYIKSGEWMDKVSVFEDFVGQEEKMGQEEEISSTFWSRFGYNDPHSSCVSIADPVLKIVGHTSTVSFISPTDTEEYSSSSVTAPSKRESFAESYAVFSKCNLFTDTQIRCVLIAALLPVYFSTTTFKLLAEDNPWECEDSWQEPLQRARSVHNTQRSERLQEWLLGAAAMFDGSVLEEYLSDPCVSWIDDYKQAITSLPVVVTLGAVNAEMKASRVIYSNTTSDSYPSMADGRRRGSTRLNGDMHILFAKQLSPSDAEHLSKALFDAESYKKSLLNATGATLLRAVKPIFNARGAHVYSLGLESAPFADPQVLQSSQAIYEHFQKMEDLLSLLPMLIKCPPPTSTTAVPAS